jgi:hypothetical protein
MPNHRQGGNEMLKENGAPSQYEMNLQLFAEGETSTEATETQTETQTATETQTTGTEQQTEQPKIKVKFNHQEMELPYDEAVTHIQKGMNFDKSVERAKQEARDAYIAEQGYVWNDKPITTEAEYKQALKEQEIYEKYQAQGLPEEVIAELVESKRFREETKAEKQTKAEQAKREAESLEFLKYFKEENGREFDTEKDTIPDEVIELANKGKTLADAYAYHANKQLKAKLAEMEAKINAQQTNSANAASSPGSVTGNGNNGADFISFEVFEANKHDSNWVMKNFDKINESRAKW